MCADVFSLSSTLLTLFPLFLFPFAIICAVFYSARVFNSDLTQWNIDKVTNMNLMFINAAAFNQIWCSTSWVGKISDADFSGSSGKVICCPPGKKFNTISKTCGQCEIGQYNDDSRVTDALPTTCVACPRNTFGPIAGLPTCSSCKSDQYR